MVKTPLSIPGTFFCIPLTDGSFAYGRVLSDPYMAFYAHRTVEPSDDLEDIEIKPILFCQAVRIRASVRWVPIGVRKLSGEAAKPVVSFMQDLANPRKCTIFDSTGMERSATPEECIGLERASSWDTHHIEQRLLDTFLGHPNEAEMRGRVRLPNLDASR